MRTVLKLLFTLIVFLSFCPPAGADAEYPLVYNFYLDEAFEAFKKGDYELAENYFMHASLVNPEDEKPLHFLNLMKRYKEGRIDVIDSARTELADKSAIIEQTLDIFEGQSQSAAKQAAVRPIYTHEDLVEQELNRFERLKQLEKSIAGNAADQFEQQPYAKLDTRFSPERRQPLLYEPETVYLNSELWARQPNTKLEIELWQSAILAGSNINRFLVITPGYLEVVRLNRDHIKITGVQRGQSFIHVWDDTGRWTFDAETIFPIAPLSPLRLDESAIEQYANPFRFSYSMDWGSFYRGPSMEGLKRQSLTYNQWIGIGGDSPYGTVDSSVNFNKLNETFEAVNYTFGLTDGKIGPFRDFSLRLFDASKYFSPLTLPRKNFRGWLFEGRTPDKLLDYSFLQGRERGTFGILTAGSINNKRDSYVEGARVTLFPEGRHRYSLNYARGFGSSREDFLKDKAYSIETRHQIRDHFLLDAEQAYDEENFAQTAGLNYKKDEFSFNVTGRNIDKDYANITGFPSNRGEVGGTITAGWNGKDMSLNSTLDTYQDRFLINPDRYRDQNFDWVTSFDRALSKSSRFDTDLYFLYEPGLISPRRDTRLTNRYSKQFDVTDKKRLDIFVGDTYQNSRYSFSPSSDFDRYSLLAGLRYPILDHLSYFANYEYSWVHEPLTDQNTQPSVFDTGLSYTQRLSPSWTSNVGFSYRDEERADGNHSFLSGEDNITGTLGFNYRPKKSDFEIFIDSRVRNIWAERESSVSSNEADVRFGLRSAWDTFFIWNPTGIVHGVVFQDKNANNKRDPGEKGLANITVQVGKTTAVTNGQGEYQAKVKAKKVLAAIDMSTLPEGHILSSKATSQVKINQHQPQRVDFALSTHSGIYGVVYFDQNANGQLDQADTFVPKVKVKLDGGKEIIVSDHAGTYFFSNIEPGVHTIEFDIKTLPLEYLPLVKIKTTIDLKEGITYVYNIPLKKNDKTQ